MDKVADGINNYLTPILITVIGFFLVQSLLEIKDELKSLQHKNENRDEWVREWIEEWQPILYWSREQMKKELK